MKKILALTLALVMVFALCACGSSSTTTAAATEAPAAEATEAPAEAEATEAPAEESSWVPTESFTLVVPFDAGGGNDVYARVLAKVAMDNGYFNGQDIIVENMPGGGAVIGQTYVACEAPQDGYTWITMTASGVTNPILKETTFTMDDFKTIVCANSDPTIMICPVDAPYNNIDEFVEWLKAGNTCLAVDSGFGTSSHIRTLDWTTKLSAQIGYDIQFESIHESSGSLQLTDIMGGHADISCNTASEVADAILNGDVKAIGIMANERYWALPDVPTFAEQGYENFIDGADRAISCSAYIPEEAYEYLVAEMTRLCSSQEFIDAMNEANMNPACKSAEEYQEFIDMKTAIVTQYKDYLLNGEG